MLVGLISDTHGAVRAEVHRAFAGVEMILHAGDVGEGVYEELAALAPLLAARGNTDRGDPRLRKPAALDLEGFSIRVTHGDELHHPDARRLAAKYAEQIVVYGHTHVRDATWIDGRLFVNPGPAGHSRAARPSVALLRLRAGAPPEVEFVDLEAPRRV